MTHSRSSHPPWAPTYTTVKNADTAINFYQKMFFWVNPIGCLAMRTAP